MIIDSLNDPKRIPSRIFSSAMRQSDTIIAIVGEPNLQADSKDIILNIDDIRVLNGAEISVQNQGTGRAGNIVFNSQSISIADESQVVASSDSGDGGSIRIDSPLLMIENGIISASARGLGLGGNISISSSFIATKKNSTIVANAENSQAGNISILSDFSSFNDTEILASSSLGANSDGDISIPQRSNELRLIKDLSKVEYSPIAIRSSCNEGNNNTLISNHGSGNNLVDLLESQQKAKYLKQRIEFASQFHYIESETGEKKPFQPLLAIEENNKGRAELIFSAKESEGLKNLLSSLENKC